MASVLCPLCGRGVDGARVGDRCPTDDRVLVPSHELSAHPGDPFLGCTIGGYPLVGLIRPSSVGPTYRALKEPGRREVAIKLLRPTGPIGPIADRLRRVMPAVYALANPCLVKPIDYGVDPTGVLFVVSETVQGKALPELVTGNEGIQHRRAVAIVSGLLRALAEAHAQGIVHGNLKPGNVVLVGSPETVRLLELGVAEVLRPRDAKPTDGVEAIGTPLYLAPEQVQGLPASPASDLYSAGVILYELLSGAPPFDRGDAVETARAHVEDPLPSLPEKLAVPAPLEAAVRRALAKSPADRFGRADEMAQALVDALAPKAARDDLGATQPMEALDLPPPGDEPAAREPAPPAPAAERAVAETRSAPQPPQAERGPEARPPPPSRRALVVGAAALAVGLLLVAAVAVIRAVPADGSGSMLDLVRTVGSGGDEGGLPALPPEAQDPGVAASPQQPPRKVVRRDAPRPADAAVAAPPVAVEAAPSPPDAATLVAPVAPKPEAPLAAVAKPDGSLLVSCTHPCRVYVDGGLVGESPKAPIPLKAGEHLLRAVNVETGDSHEQTIVIKSEERTRVDLSL